MIRYRGIRSGDAPPSVLRPIGVGDIVLTSSFGAKHMEQHGTPHSAKHWEHQGMATITSIPCDLDVKALMDQLHIEAGSDDASAFMRLVAQSKDVACPKVVYRACFIDARGHDTVTISGITFTSRTLRKNLGRAERVFAYVATCGREIDRIPLPAGDMLMEFWRDAIKTSLLAAARQYLTDHLTRRYRLRKTASISPGSGDADTWPIQQQLELFTLLGGIGEVRRQSGVDLTDSFLMVPNKTVSGIRFSTETDFRSCQVCHRQECPSRSAPFDPKLWESMQHE